MQARRIEACCVSARTGEGVRGLVEAVVDRVRQERGVVSEGVWYAETPIVRRVVEEPIRVVRVADGFEVRGGKVGQVIAMLGVESEEARAEVARRLRRMGVTAALRRAGVQPDDRVRVGEAELRWRL